MLDLVQATPPAIARPHAPAVTVEDLWGVDGLASIADEWGHLWERCPWATPFQSPEWLLTWCRTFEPEDVWGIALRRGGELVGLAPLEKRRAGGERVVTLLGGGVSDYLDILLAPGFARSDIDAMLTHLSSRRARWDACELPRLRSASPLLTEGAPDGLTDRRWHSEPSPVLRLPARAEDLPDVFPDRLVASLSYHRRRAERLGRARVEVLADEGRLEALFDALFALHHARWAARGVVGALGDPKVQLFHRRAARGLLARGVVRLYTLFWDDKPAAVLYGFCHRRRAYYYIGGVDPALERYSVGTLIVGHAILEAAREGAMEFDFLRGREPYKYAWGAVDQASYGRTLRRRHAP